jgi:hypothetical protein
MNKDQAILAFHAVCMIIQVVEVKGSLFEYAQSYAKKGIELTDPESIVAQIPYMQGNMKAWKGSAAREAKLRLKEILKILEREDT